MASASAQRHFLDLNQYQSNSEQIAESDAFLGVGMGWHACHRPRCRCHPNVARRETASAVMRGGARLQTPACQATLREHRCCCVTLPGAPLLLYVVLQASCATSACLAAALCPPAASKRTRFVWFTHLGCGGLV